MPSIWQSIYGAVSHDKINGLIQLEYLCGLFMPVTTALKTNRRGHGWTSTVHVTDNTRHKKVDYFSEPGPINMQEHCEYAVIYIYVPMKYGDRTCTERRSKIGTPKLNFSRIQFD